MLTTPFVKLFLTILLEYPKHSLSMMLLASGMLSLEEEWHLQSLYPCLKTWRLFLLLESFISALTSLIAFLDLPLCLWSRQVILTERFWKLFGPLLIKSPLLQDLCLWPTIKIFWLTFVLFFLLTLILQSKAYAKNTRLLVMGWTRQRNSLRGSLNLWILLCVAYKEDLILSYLTWAILTERPTSMKHSVLKNKD